MLDKLAAIEAKYSQIEARLGVPETYDDPALVAKLNQEQTELQPLVETFRAYQQTRAEKEEAEALLSDPEMKELAQEELRRAQEELERLEHELQLLLLPKDPNDQKNVIVEIRAGVGGEEAALFAHSLYRMYSMYAESHRWKTEVDSVNETELGGIKEISFTIEGAGAYSRLKYESGVHRVQRVPETESGGASTPPPPRWPSCRRWRRRTCSSIPRISRCRCSAPPGRGDSMSTRPPPQSG